MNCPYFEPNCRQDEMSASMASCPDCRRFVKACPQCATANRALANFCRSCGTLLPTSAGNWLGYKGGPQRLGINDAEPPRPSGTSIRLDYERVGTGLQLGDPCRSLLSVDGDLLAVTQSGTVAITNPLHPGPVRHFQVNGPLTCEPCIDSGVLYVGSRGQLGAWSLGTTTMASPHLKALWTIPLSGTPVQALTAVADRLYVTVFTGRQKEVRAVEGLSAKTPATTRLVYAGPDVSWVAGDPAGTRLVFFSEEPDGSTLLHTISGSTSATHVMSLAPVAEHPIALGGSAAYGIFGEKRQLFAIDVNVGTVTETFDGDTQAFSLSYAGKADWNRDAVRIDSAGVVFSRFGARDSFSHLDRAVRGSPVVVRGRAAVVGLQDGRVLVYDLANPPRHHVWRLSTHGEAAITALASFGHFIAAGNERGTVEMIALRTTTGDA